MTTLLQPPIRRDRAVVGSAVFVITALCWAYLFLLSARMGSMGSPLAMPMTSAWDRQDVVLMWTMWATMMAAMMLPSAWPMIRAYSVTVTSPRAGVAGSVPAFVGGYLVAWSGFAVAATGAQWALHDASLVTPMGESDHHLLGGLILTGAGVYQFTNLKNACLAQCRAPLGFLLNHWRPGRRGALVMGLHHGVLCIGCCWALMAMLFVLGVMNLWWIAVVAAVVLFEKLVPSSRLTVVLGALLVVWGVALTLGVGT